MGDILFRSFNNIRLVFSLSNKKKYFKWPKAKKKVIYCLISHFYLNIFEKCYFKQYHYAAVALSINVVLLSRIGLEKRHIL